MRGIRAHPPHRQQITCVTNGRQQTENDTELIVLLQTLPIEPDDHRQTDHREWDSDELPDRRSLAEQHHARSDHDENLEICEQCRQPRTDIHDAPMPEP